MGVLVVLVIPAITVRLIVKHADHLNDCAVADFDLVHQVAEAS
jgi:hypothetical protein